VRSTESASTVDPKDLLKLTLYARLAAVHPLCVQAQYGEKGSVDREVHEKKWSLLGEDL
jgi:hypothetical protein